VGEKRKRKTNMATIRNVADRAEVSISTVSRVVNGNRPVRPDIRERVLQAIKELDYRPNYLARGLRARNSSMLGLIIPDNSNPFYAEVARAIEDAGFAAGYSVILCNTDLSNEKQQAYIDVLLSHKVEGVILINMNLVTLDNLERLMAEHIPVILANNDIRIPATDQILVDDYQGGYQAGQYLLRLNHRRIGCISLQSQFPHIPKRITGFRQALTEAGIELSDELCAIGNGRYDSGYQATQDLIRRQPDLTAIFVFNDLMALGAMNALRAEGRRIPADVSIIGYDNIFYSSTFEPALTTIAQPIATIGEECITHLLERIEHLDRPPMQVTLPTELIERASCRCLFSD
jgi:LacI family transcriptional regulator